MYTYALPMGAHGPVYTCTHSFRTRPVSCAFDLAHYGELLDAAVAGGYRFATFDAEPQPQDLFLRHDYTSNKNKQQCDE